MRLSATEHNQQFSAQNLTNTAWAFSPLSVHDAPLFDAISSAAHARMPSSGTLSERDLAAIAWSMAASGYPHMPLLAALSSRLMHTITEFAPRSLANIAWSFATLGYVNEPLMPAIAEEVLHKITDAMKPLFKPGEVSGRQDGSPGDPALASADRASQDLITNLNAVAWALDFTNTLTNAFDFEVHQALRQLATSRDRMLAERIACNPPPAAPPEQPPEVFLAQGADPHVPPWIVVDLPELCVVHKPPGWEVDCSDVGTGLWLSSYLQRRYSPQEAPLVHYAEYQFGMVHRLDRVSSGLLLVGKSFVGFHMLGWQLNTGRLEREYVVVTHGWVAPELRFVDANVSHIHAEGSKESKIVEHGGKPSQTQLTTLGHFTLDGHKEDRFSLVVIQIRTGRRHQIRAHMAHIGHPTVADGKYMVREKYVRDKQWCARNFLHRYRLGFKGVDGSEHEAVAPLPEDLRVAAMRLVPVGPRSAAALEEWTAAASVRCRPPRAWSTYEGLIMNDV